MRNGRIAGELAAGIFQGTNLLGSFLSPHVGLWSVFRGTWLGVLLAAVLFYMRWCVNEAARIDGYFPI